MIGRVLLNCIEFISSLFPRNKHIWITGRTDPFLGDTAAPSFFDNSKYFFLYLVNNTEENVFWITCSKDEFEKMKEMDLPVIKYNSLRHCWLILRTRFFFHHYGFNQISEELQRGSIQINLWHGTPLKKIGFDVIPQIKQKDSMYLKFLKRHGRSYVASTSEYLSERILSGAFDLNPNMIMNYGYPRMDILGASEKEIYEFCAKYSKELIKYIDATKKYNKVFLYMPTWRDNDENYFTKAKINYLKLEEELEKINGILFIKLHPLTPKSEIPVCENIKRIDNDVDIYPFLSYVDYLITDYSSIYFDFLVLDREIIFIPYDLHSYMESRELYFDYEKVTPGVKYYSFDEFINNIKNLSKLNYKKERDRLRSNFYDDYSFNASERIYKYIKNQ